MPMYYTDPTRESEPTALPDVEVFRQPGIIGPIRWDGEPLEPGWYWWSCSPGCLPDSEPIGPFKSEAEALADARGE